MRLLPLVLILGPVSLAGPGPDVRDTDDVTKVPDFEAPKPLRAAGAPIRTEEPGYASPAWFDVTGDGRADLVVGQFAGGKMAIYPGQEDGSLGERQWLQADGKVAEVPGVW